MKGSIFGTVISMMMNPSKAVKGAVGQTKWYFSVMVSAIAFGFFFLQTGMDLYKTGQKNSLFVIFSALTGVGYGLLIIPIIGLLVWMFLKFAGSPKNLKWTISSICLSYSGALVYGLAGVMFSVFFDWKTAVAFGVTGVLWATGPMIIAIKEMTGGKLGLSVGIATVVCTFVLVTWSFFGQL